jgi:hypothetical protein
LKDREPFGATEPGALVMDSNPAARQWTHRLFAGIREFAITTIGLALVYVLLWLAYIGIHALENWPLPL